jgi:hypothetical protein
MSRIRSCSLAIACAVVRRAAREQLTDVPVDADIEALVSLAMWVPAYPKLVDERAEHNAGRSSR